MEQWESVLVRLEQGVLFEEVRYGVLEVCNITGVEFVLAGLRTKRLTDLFIVFLQFVERTL